MIEDLDFYLGNIKKCICKLNTNTNLQAVAYILATYFGHIIFEGGLKVLAHLQC